MEVSVSIARSVMSMLVLSRSLWPTLPPAAVFTLKMCTYGGIVPWVQRRTSDLLPWEYGEPPVAGFGMRTIRRISIHNSSQHRELLDSGGNERPTKGAVRRRFHAASGTRRIPVRLGRTRGIRLLRSRRNRSLVHRSRQLESNPCDRGKHSSVPFRAV